jgi:hypothetical protein
MKTRTSLYEPELELLRCRTHQCPRRAERGGFCDKCAGEIRWLNQLARRAERPSWLETAVLVAVCGGVICFIGWRASLALAAWWISGGAQ